VPCEIHNPGERRRGAVAQQFGLNPSGPQGRRVYLSFVEQAEEMHGRMTRDMAFGAKERLQPGTPKHQPCVMSSERT